MCCCPRTLYFLPFFHSVFHINRTESAEGNGRRIKCIIIFNFDKALISLFFPPLPSHLAGVGRRPRTPRCAAPRETPGASRGPAAAAGKGDGEKSAVGNALFFSHLVFSSVAIHWTGWKHQRIHGGSRSSSLLGSGSKKHKVGKNIRTVY